MLIRQANPHDARSLHDLILLSAATQRHADFDETGWQEAKYFCNQGGNTGCYKARASTMAVPVCESFDIHLPGECKADRGIVFSPWHWIAANNTVQTTF